MNSTVNRPPHLGPRTKSPVLRFAAGAFAACVCSHGTPALAQAFNQWQGSGSNWSTGANWSSGSISNYGQLEFKGLGNATSNNDAGAVSQWRVYFSGSQAYTLTSGGGALNLFDFNFPPRAHSWVLSDSAVTQTFSTLDVNFAATDGPNFGQISARSTGDLVFNNVGITGSQIAQVRIAGQSTGKVIVNGAISGSSKAIVIGIKEDGGAATTTDVVFNGTNTYSGDTFVNAGSLSFGSGGTSNNSVIRLGDISGANSATIKLTSATGGQNIGSLLNPRVGSTGTLTLSSENTSNTNTWSGNFALDRGLTVSQSAGGTLALSGTSLDIKAQMMKFSGGGDFNVTGALQNTVSGGQIEHNGTGLLRFGAANTYSGSTSINSGTVRVDVAPSGTGLTSTYFVGNGGATGTAASLLIGGGAGGTSGGIIFGNPVTANAGSGGNRVIGGSNTTGTNSFSGTVTLNDSNTTLRAATGGTVNFNTISAGALQTVAVGGGGNNGTVQLTGISDNLNLAATVNSGTLVLAKTSSSTVHSVGGTLAVNSGATAQLGGTGGDQIFNSGSIMVNSGGVFDANDRSETVTNTSLSGTGIGGTGALVNSGSSSSAITSTGSTTLAAATAIGVTNSGASLTLNGTLTGSGALTKVGDGRLVLNGSGTGFTAATTVSDGTLEVAAANALGGTSGVSVNSGGTLLLSGAAGNRIKDTAPLMLGGGTFAAAGLSETLGALSLTANSIIDFGAGASILEFGGTSDLGAFTLNIWNWSGTPVDGGGFDQLRFNALADLNQLTQIKFYSDDGMNQLSPVGPYPANAFVGAFGEVAPVPEPSGVLIGLTMFGLAGWRERRKSDARRRAERLALAH